MALLTVGSLFSGIGGFDLGLERSGGFRTSWFCEQDEFCQRVLAKHWPGVPCHPDITELHHPQPVDVLCGGFPCQDLSVAGKGAGLAGARSGLWSEYARLIGELRPSYVVVENVTALLARGLGTVLGDLATLGYDAEWDCIPASALGAPHQRDRVWLVAYPDGSELREQPVSVSGSGREALVAVDGQAQPLADPDGEGQLQQEGPERQERGRLGDSGREVADADSERRARRAGQQRPAGRHEPQDGSAGVADSHSERRPQGVREPAWPSERPWQGNALGVSERDSDGWWAAEPDVGRVAHGVPSRMDRTAALGNALVPQIATWIGNRILTYEAEGAVSRAA